MNHKIVEKLETEIEQAIVRIVADLGLEHLPLLPSGKTMHLMAKAAVAVYEVAVENQQGANQ